MDRFANEHYIRMVGPSQQGSSLYDQYRNTYIDWVNTITSGSAAWDTSNNFVPQIAPPTVAAFKTEISEEPMARLANKFAVGCDPEFVVVNKGRIVSVAALGHDGPVGFDHHGLCAELRPDHAKGTFTLVKRIQELLRTNSKLKTFAVHQWRGGAYLNDGVNRVSLGGHIHFGFTGENMPKDLLPALDALTKLLEHLDILPQHESTTRRTVTEYGKWSQIRTDTADGHVEYRTMASWLHDPLVAFAALTLAKLVACDPQLALDQLKKATSQAALIKYLEAFVTKDINAHRLLTRLERCKKALQMDPEKDLKEAWEVEL